MIIERPEYIRRIEKTNKWMLVYGRRKTGKTFLINKFIKFDEYFFVKTDKSILTKESKQISYETFMEILKRSLDEKKTVVIDEFHRLGTEFFDFIHFVEKKGKLILISSTLFLSKKLITSNSALLGLFAECPVEVISLKDVLNALKGFKFSNKERLELAILLREPIAIDYFDEKKSAREIIVNVVLGSLKTIPALTGEIFFEEEREMSAVYEGVLRAVSLGKGVSGEIASYLFSKWLIKKDDPSIIQQYLNNLLSFGIIKRIEMVNKKRFVYKLKSSLAKIYYYIDEKYNLSERTVSEKELAVIINEVMPKIVEENVREHLAEKFGLREGVIEGKDYEIDGCLLKFNKPVMAIEIKWKKMRKADITRSVETVHKVACERRVLFVQDKSDKAIKEAMKKTDIGKKIEVFDVDDL
ncbi:MAG: AAA family ATPase [Candidatus Woesearchaeota archaeon]|nr:AAA family ATPase [Candidatus Woesearchaeota archaeon]